MINGPMISKLAPYARGKKNTKRKAKSKRKPKILKSVVAELASQIKAPTLYDVEQKIGADTIDAGLVLRAVLVKRKQLADLASKTTRKIRAQEQEKLDAEINEKKGFIYLIENKAFDGWIKCGMTIDRENRLGQYNSYDPTRGFSFIATRIVLNRRVAERALLKKVLAASQLRNGEWFKIDKDTCIKIFNEI